MDKSTSNSCPTESQNYHEHNRKSECTDDENANPTEPNELNNNTNELFDIDSSDLDYDSSDMDRQEVKNLLLQTVNTEPDSHNVSDEGQCTNTSIVTSDHSVDNTSNVPTEMHSNENNSVIESEHIENTNDMPKPQPADNCLQDNDSTLTPNNEYTEDEEPIFDFLGKANEIVCFYLSNIEMHFIQRYIYLIQSHPLITNTNTHTIASGELHTNQIKLLDKRIYDCFSIVVDFFVSLCVVKWLCYKSDSKDTTCRM